MIDAILKGKLFPTEDVVTSCVLGLLAKMPPEHDLLAWLRRARPWPRSAMNAPLSFRRDATIDVRLWPSTAAHGQRDAFVMVTDGDAAHAIVLEATYGAQKSNWDSIDPQDHHVDQLVRYWKALHVADMPGVAEAFLARAEKTVIYSPRIARPLRRTSTKAYKEVAALSAWRGFLGAKRGPSPKRCEGRERWPAPGSSHCSSIWA